VDAAEGRIKSSAGPFSVGFDIIQRSAGDYASRSLETFMTFDIQEILVYFPTATRFC